jgi:hypothetical protein
MPVSFQGFTLENSRNSQDHVGIFVIINALQRFPSHFAARSYLVIWPPGPVTLGQSTNNGFHNFSIYWGSTQRVRLIMAIPVAFTEVGTYTQE